MDGSALPGELHPLHVFPDDDIYHDHQFFSHNFDNPLDNFVNFDHHVLQYNFKPIANNLNYNFKHDLNTDFKHDFNYDYSFLYHIVHNTLHYNFHDVLHYDIKHNFHIIPNYDIVIHYLNLHDFLPGHNFKHFVHDCGFNYCK